VYRHVIIRALEIRDENDIIHGMTHGELEARTLEAERAQASAPPDVSRQLRLTAQAEADARCGSRAYRRRARRASGEWRLHCLSACT
jgi:hypothetical protein